MRGGTGTLTVGAATLTAPSVTLGGASEGDATIQSGGTLSTGALTVAGTSTGTLAINDGSTTTVSGDTIVGDQASGTVTQTGSATLATNNLTIGNQNSGAGTYALGGNLSATVNGNLTLGSQVGSSGTFSLDTNPGDSAALTVKNGNLIVGDQGAGTFTQLAGTNTINGNLVIGNNNGVSQPPPSTYTLGGTGNVSVSGDLQVGATTGTGTFNMNQQATDEAQATVGSFTVGGGDGILGGGTVNVQSLAIGNVLVPPGALDAQGTASVSGNGLINAANQLAVGAPSGAASPLTIQNGGTVLVGTTVNNLNSAGGLEIGGAASLTLGLAAGQPAPDITTTGGLGLGGAITLQALAGDYALNTFIPLIDSSSITNLNISGLSNSNPLGFGSGTTVGNDEEFSITNSAGNAAGNIFVPASVGNNEYLVPEIEQQTVNGVLTDEFGVEVAPSCGSIIQNRIQKSPAGPLDSTLQQQIMTAAFTPNFTLSLPQAAVDCGLMGFDWLQEVTIPTSTPFFAKASPNTPVTAQVNDPPPGGWTYFPLECPDNQLSSFDAPALSNAPNAAVYYDPELPSSDSASTLYRDTTTASDCLVYPIALAPPLGGNSLCFFDAPEDNNLTDDQSLSFLTQLVGYDILPDGQEEYFGFPLSDDDYVNWESNFHCIIGACAGGVNQTSSVVAVDDPEDFAGGVTVLPSNVSEPGSGVILLGGLARIIHEGLVAAQ